MTLPRSLTADELRLASWMLEHGEPDATVFLEQLERARVVAECSCGCPSVDFDVDGEVAPSGGVRVLGDFLYRDGTGALAGAFIFARLGVLAGIDVYSTTGDAPRELPSPDDLRPADDRELNRQVSKARAPKKKQ